MAELLDWSESKVSRILTGHVTPSEIELAGLLALCGVVSTQRDRLLEICKDQALFNWSVERHAIGRYQLTASKIVDFHNSLVPPLLQTASYSRSTASRMVNIEDDDLDSWIATRLQAQAIFDRMNSKAPTVTFFMHQLALDLPVGGRQVMSDQLHHILQLAVRRNVVIRVIPTSIGAHPGAFGSFCFMEFEEFQSIVYVEDEIEGHFLEDSDKVGKYRHLCCRPVDGGIRPQ